MLIAAIILVLAALVRIAPTIDPSLVNFSPVMAIAFCGGVYFRPGWRWALPFGALALSDLYLNHFYAREYGFHWSLAGLGARTACFGGALLIVRPWREIGRLVPRLLIAFLAASVVYVIFYSAFFTHPAGLADGLRAYFNYAERASGGPHDQPWFYYGAILWPHTQGGIHWGEPLLLLGALAGAILTFSPQANPTHRALAAFTATLLLIYSVIPYKTPWLLLTPYAGLALLAGLGAAHSARWLPEKIGRFTPAFFGLALVLAGAWRAGPALDRYANDSRNPYLYQPTSPDLARLVTTLETQALDKKIAVISPDHAWPLPWYLRHRATVGYFSTPPQNLSAYDMVLFDSRLDLPPPAAATAFGLRPDILLWSAPR